jgi:hypothetical protein
MKTLPREPWRGGQICGYQTAYGLPWSVFCGEFKKLGSPLCAHHDKELREEHGGVLPRFADGNALGLRITICSASWLVRDVHGELRGAARTLPELKERYGFTLKWEPYEGDTPVDPTAEELDAFNAQT